MPDAQVLLELGVAGRLGLGGGDSQPLEHGAWQNVLRLVDTDEPKTQGRRSWQAGEPAKR